MKRFGWTAALVLVATTPAYGETAEPDLKLWRFDCGLMPGIPLAMFSDTFAYGDEVMDMVVSCYMIKHGDQYMIWDTGFGTEYLEGDPGGPFKVEMKRSLVDQIAELGVMPDDVAIVGISHNHGDHVGQAVHFPKAKLLMGAADLAEMRSPDHPPSVEPHRIAPWLAPDSNAEGVRSDKDVFGDGSVTMLAMPGHTQGHYSLLVRLDKMGPVLLSGDEFHFAQQVTNKSVPPFNWNRAATLASHDRFSGIAANLGATVIIQHEPADVEALPVAPKAAE